jgi:2-polyprenyl-3-methyl-5-hydroxy-6-metoxy-1,4-benzoquinol methylase
VKLDDIRSREPGDLFTLNDRALTFRDPAGQLYLTAAHAIRRIRPEAAAQTRAYIDSEFRARLERGGDLIAAEIVVPATSLSASTGELWLRHPRIDPISYPWEWTTAQWCSAADLTLRLAGQAIDAGWNLKDATPLNILFHGAQPVLVDVLSFEPRDPNSTVWLAYGQFVRTFLLPLLAAKYLRWPLEATLLWRDGYEPATIYRALQPWQRLYPGLLDVVTLATLLDGSSKSAQRMRKTPSVSDPALATHILHKRLARLARQIRHAAQSNQSSQWSGYEKSATHYLPADVESKQQFVRRMLDCCRPARVLDIGANTGTYSLLAADAGAQVVALDSDRAALEKLWSTANQLKKSVTTLVANIARPTPATGWRNEEQLSLLDRLGGKFDMVLMLAVIHHLLLREQVPLNHIGELCSNLTCRWLILEWVPPSDPMFQEWLRGRDHLYGHLSEDDLIRAFAPWFRIADRSTLDNQRTLLLLERNDASDSAYGVGPG